MAGLHYEFCTEEEKHIVLQLSCNELSVSHSKIVVNAFCFVFVL